MENKIIKDIIEKLNKYEITVDEKAASKLYDFYRLLAKKNETVNLTAITDYESFISKHVSLHGKKPKVIKNEGMVSSEKTPLAKLVEVLHKKHILLKSEVDYIL